MRAVVLNPIPGIELRTAARGWASNQLLDLFGDVAALSAKDYFRSRHVPK
jgi:hypothetical protein